MGWGRLSKIPGSQAWGLSLYSQHSYKKLGVSGCIHDPISKELVTKEEADKFPELIGQAI